MSSASSRARVVRVNPVIYGSCGVSAVDLLNLANALFAAIPPPPATTTTTATAQPLVSAIIGPASEFFCDVIDKLGSQQGVPIFSYLCVEPSLPVAGEGHVMLMTTAPTNVASVTALGAVLYQFEWKYVAMFYGDDDIYVQLAQQVQLVLAGQEQFDVVFTRQVDAGLSVENATALLRQINRSITKGAVHSNTRCICYCYFI